MAYNEQTQNTYANLANMAPDAVRQLWQTVIDTFERNEDWFSEFEGGLSSPIVTKTDTSVGAGSILNITTRAGYYGEGKSGDALFENDSDYEEDLINNYQLKVDWLRNAARHNKRGDELMGMRDELANGSTKLLGEWMGRQKTQRMMMLFRARGSAVNEIIAGGASSVDLLGSADGLTWDEITSAQARLSPLGGMPAMVGRVDGNEVRRYLVLGTTPGLLSLKQDPDYKENVQQAGVSGSGNPLFRGGYVDIDGNIIREYNPIDHDGHGPIGSPWNPKAYLGEAIVAGTGTFAIKGGGSAAAAAKTNKLYFKFFDGHAFEFMPGDVLAQGSATRYLLIINPANAAVDPLKVGMYSYTTGNNGNQITILQRLGATAAGDRVTTLGSVTWNTGAWANKHTDVHPIGALVVQCNAKGVPIGTTVILGKGAALRGYGQYRNWRTQDTKNGGFVTERYISSVFGQTLRLNTMGIAPGFVRIRHAINYVGYGLPTVA